MDCMRYRGYTRRKNMLRQNLEYHQQQFRTFYFAQCALDSDSVLYDRELHVYTYRILESVYIGRIRDRLHFGVLCSFNCDLHFSAAHVIKISADSSSIKPERDDVLSDLISLI